MNDKSNISSIVEIVFIDSTGRYEATYMRGELIRMFTNSVCQAPLELGFTLKETLINLKALGFGESNRKNSFTMTPPSNEETPMRFKFIKGALDE